LRCAIYTRKSTEHGLELEFNSLDSQRESCEAYIKSQASEGWRLVSTRYDDPAFSGGNLARPALQQLLKDIQAGLVDVIVVYKIDRLTRSLADFAKLVELFDAKSVSFVAVTQQFNTTTSMGRLTLNVLLSFAQFERELASERVRDKVAASRKKGKWTGGSVPLGYEVKDKRLVVNPAEAKTVQMIFARYAALRSFQKLIDELNARGVVTKTRPMKGKTRGGVQFTNGPLAYLLKNRTYLGETGHAGVWFPGEHEPIIAPDVFDKVQSVFKANTEGRTGRRQQSGALLTGRIYDDRSNRMSPSFTVKRGVRYPFYISTALLTGRRSGVGSVGRVSASTIEGAVLRALRQNIEVNAKAAPLLPHELIERYVERVVIETKRVVVTVMGSDERPSSSFNIPWAEKIKDLARIEGDKPGQDLPQPSPQLIQSVVRAHQWLKSLIDGTYDSVEALARAVDLHPKVIRSRIRLAFLAPKITRELLQGILPVSANINELTSAVHWSWVQQQGQLTGWTQRNAKFQDG
jgi:DNA invertase Pin-like site-specific DNA recombinase